MAYRSRRAPARRPARASRSNGVRGRARTGNGARKRAGSRSVGQQTLKIVVEQLPATQIARPDGPLQVQAAAPKKAKF